MNAHMADGAEVLYTKPSVPLFGSICLSLVFARFVFTRFVLACCLLAA